MRLLKPFEAAGMSSRSMRMVLQQSTRLSLSTPFQLGCIRSSLTDLPSINRTDAPWGLSRLSQDTAVIGSDGALAYPYTYDASAGAAADIFIVGVFISSIFALVSLLTVSIDTGILTTHVSAERLERILNSNGTLVCFRTNSADVLHGVLLSVDML